MTEQKLDETMREYFSEKEEITPELKENIGLLLLKAEAGKQRKQFFLLAMAVSLYSIGIFAVCREMMEMSPVLVWLFVNMCLAVAGSGILSLIIRTQNKTKEA